MEAQWEVIWMHFFSFFDIYVILMAEKAKLQLEETSWEEAWRWFNSQPCWEVAWGAVSLGGLVGLKWQALFHQAPRAVLEASFRQSHWPSLCVCNSAWVLYDLGVSERYLVDITMETESLIVLGSTSTPEAVLMVECWALGQKYAANRCPRKISMGMVAMLGRWTRSLCFLVQESRGSVLSMRDVCLRMREGEGKGDSRKAAVGFVARTCAFSPGV